MNSLPKVTVLMPVYNAGTYLAETIQSILNQSFADFEFLIINDASTDDSVSIIESFEDPRIRLVHNEQNLRISNTLNKGIQLAKGEFIARMDADDIALPERLAKQVAFLNTHPSVGIVGTAFEMFTPEGTTTLNAPPTDIDDLKVHLLFGCYIGHPTLMARKELLLINQYNSDFALCCDDYELWSRLLEKTQFANLPDVLLKYRLHNKQLTNYSSIDPSQYFKLIYQSMLVRYLHMKPTSVELTLHYMLFNQIVYGSPQLLLNYLEKLVQHNQKTQFFNPSSFNKVLFKFCYPILKQLQDKVTSLDDFKNVQNIYKFLGEKFDSKTEKQLHTKVIWQTIKQPFTKRCRWGYFLGKNLLYIDISKQNRTIQWFEPKKLPIFINCRDRVNCLKTLVDYLLKQGYKNLILLDNDSTYPPLLEYYSTLEGHSSIKTIFLGKNWGAYALWEANLLKKLKIKTPFIYTDPDIIPVEDCPDDFISYFLKIMLQDRFKRKVGFGLKIDDLPEHYRFKSEVIDWETKFWSRPTHNQLYKADLDTTFSLYPGIPKKFVKNNQFYDAYRTSDPYIARHLPWYADTDNPTVEDLYYRQMADKASTTWCDTEIPEFITTQAIS